MLGSVCLSLGLPHSLTTPIGLVDSINHYGLVVTYSSGLYLSLLHSTLAQPIALFHGFTGFSLTMFDSTPLYITLYLGSIVPYLAVLYQGSI